MNRRHFFSTLAKAAAGFAILPTAVTYARNWSGVLIPAPLDLNALMREVYKIQRARCGCRETIDCFTDRETAKNIQRAYTAYTAALLGSPFDFSGFRNLPLAREPWL